MFENNFIVIRFIFVLLCLFVTQQLVAAEEPVAVEELVAAEDENISPWKSTTELGYVNVSGNTNTETLKFVFDISYDEDKWLHKAHAESLSSQTKITDTSVDPNVTTESRSAAKWLVTAQSDFKLNDVDYFYGLLSYEDDRFSGFHFQAKLGLGYGRRVIHTDSHELKLEIGPGFRAFKLEATTPPADAVIIDRQNETLIRMNAGYVWTISETSKFTEDVTAESGENQNELKSVTALSANINSTLAMKFSYTIKHLDKVPAETEKTDKELTVTLVFML
jgi:putative salt-induced outer membrane protein